MYFPCLFPLTDGTHTCTYSCTVTASEDVGLFRGLCSGRLWGHLRQWSYLECHPGCCVIVLFTRHSSLHWGADWQLPSLEWSSCFFDSAKAIWCILTIIGATATVMFSKPLCYFPEGCPWGIFWVAARSKEAFRLMTDGRTAVLWRSEIRQPNHHHLKGHTVFFIVSLSLSITREAIIPHIHSGFITVTFTYGILKK